MKQETYNIYSGTFSGFRNKYFAKIVLFLKNNQVKKVLDNACGQGDFLKECKRAGIDGYGIDLDTKWVSYSKKRGYKVKYGNTYKIPFKNSTFDAVFSQSLIEHLDDPIKAVKEMKRVVRKGGYVIVSSPTPENDFWNDPTHIRPHTPKSMSTIFDMCDLEQIEISYVLFYLLGIKIGWNFLYKLLNIIPLPVGSNIIGIAKK